MSSDLQEMPLMEHLLELRKTLMHIFGSVLVIFLGLIYFSRDLYNHFAAPLRSQLPATATMIATDISSTFVAPLKLTLFTSIFLAIPYILHQIWKFVAPAMYEKERKIAIPILASSVVLFYAGVAFAYFVALPNVIRFFISVSPQTVLPMTDINSYLDFALKLFLVFGVTFEIPVAVLLLILAKIISVQSLVEKRRYIIVGCFGVSAIVTPPDGFSMILLAIPMWLLFELGIIFGRVIEGPKRAV